ncbi:hypothetical protein FOL47_002898 [Perkinsus chesapeaki]|uniref:Uncharacterized protein n=1 Tax=Perkinsus chesapeaki TaxID=330153 RepID=A0A7J6MAT5_PERCH|nr:hypothetical protein FOL47_002898 [Perkinsus chesapeaki]
MLLATPRARLLPLARLRAFSGEAAKYDPAPFGPQGGEGPAGGGRSGASWENDPRFQAHKKLDQGRMPPKDWKLGPYAANKFFVSPSKGSTDIDDEEDNRDPSGFTMNVLIVLAFIYSVSCLTPGESFYSRRRRLIRERIRQEYDLPVGWDDDIEGEEAPLTPSGWGTVDLVTSNTVGQKDEDEKSSSAVFLKPQVLSPGDSFYLTTMSLDTAFLQLSFTLPGRYTLPTVNSLPALKATASQKAWLASQHQRRSYQGSSPNFDRLQWEVEAFLGPYCKQVTDEGVRMITDEKGFPALVRICTQHPSDTSWWWKDKCPECRSVYNSRIAALNPVSSDSRTIVGNLKSAAPGSIEKQLSLPSLAAPGATDKAGRALREARVRALQKYPYNVARKGTDTNPTSFTGRVLSIRNNGLQFLGRQFTKPAVAWH